MKLFKKLQILPLLISVSIISSLSAQETDYKSFSSSKTMSFYEIVNAKRTEFTELRSKGELTRAQVKEEKQFERWVYSQLDRIDGTGSLPDSSVKDYTREIVNKSIETNKFSAKGVSVNSWTQVGPVGNPEANGYTAYPGKGRINVVVEDPTNTNIMYVGAAAGGVWKTIDNGSSWSPITDDFAGIGVTDIIVDPNNTDIVYVATGDEDAQHISSIGVYKSTNGGTSWSATGLTFDLSENEYIRDIAFSPDNSNKIFALTNEEIKVSTNGGTDWTNITVVNQFSFVENFQTIIFDPNDSNKVVVSDYYDGIYYSTDGGENFKLHNALTGQETRSQLKLTTSANDNDFFYGLTEDGIFRKYRFAFDETASDLVSSTTISGFNSQGGYNMCVAASPTNKNNIIIGAVRGYTSADNGSSFSVALNPYNDPAGVGFYVHPDHHHLSFLADGTTVLNGHDGGVHKGTFGGTEDTWIDLSPGLIITQSYNIAVTQESNGDNFMMANQDNDGFSKVLKDGTRQWVSAVAGDGTATGIDFTTPDTRYLGGTYGSLSRTDDGFSSSYNSAVSLLEADQDNASFVSPMAMHPTVSSTIYAGHGDLKKSTDKGVNFSALGTGLTLVNFVEVVSNQESTRIFVINESSEAKLSIDDGSTWSSISAPTDQKINSFSAIANTTTVYATVSGYNSGNKVYKSVDNGTTWTNISNDLPNIIMKEVIVKTDSNNEILFLATELGVYVRTNEATSWTKLGSGLPNVRVDDLKINYTDQNLYAGTFGRGMWKIDISDSSLGINEDVFTIENEPQVYPNPITDDIFTIKLKENVVATYTIYNVLGGSMKSDVFSNEIQVSTESLSNGVYLLRVTAEGKTFRKKIIVK